MASWGRLKGISFTAIPFSTMTLHWIMMYVLMYALAGVVQSDSGKQRVTFSNGEGVGTDT